MNAAPHPARGMGPLIVVLVLGFSSLCVSLMQSRVLPIQAELPTLLGTSASNASWVVTGWTKQSCKPACGWRQRESPCS